MKRVLIVGASILQLPAICKAKEMGFTVGVADYNPKAVGIPFADEYYDVSTIDIDGIVSAARSFRPDGIMTLATDMPMRAVAKACKECGLPGISYETAVKATDKGEMIKAFEAHDVAHPWFFVVPDMATLEWTADALSYPCILKPTDNAGSRGVVLCRSHDELVCGYHYARKASRSGAVIIEEYLQGPEFSVEVMVIDGEPKVLQITDKLTTGAPHFVEMGHSQPTRQPDSVQSQIKDLTVRACKAVGINQGPAHVEMILTKDGPKMVELGARMGGDCITTHLVPLSTGIDMVASTILLSCGETINIEPEIRKGAAIRFIDAEKGTICGIDGVEAAKRIPGVKEISFAHQIGETIGEIESSVDRAGFVIAQGDSAEQAVEICDSALRLIHIRVE